MKISTFFLSFCGFCILYLCNADWIDELIENYLVSDYEEVAPFISSVTAGTEEFDQLVEELSQAKRKWWLPYPLILITVLSVSSLSIFLHYHNSLTLQSCGFLRKVFQRITNCRKSCADKEEIQTIVAEFLEKKLKQLYGNKESDDVPVKLLWKGGTLVESSIHCNIRDESKLRHMQQHLLQSKLLFRSSDGGGDESVTLAPSTSETSTARKMAEIRKLLESEQELQRFVDRGAGTDDIVEGCRGENSSSMSHFQGAQLASTKGNLENRTDQGRKKDPEGKFNSEWDGSPDQKLMNRIRLLESRLRLEELKNKNWINRMSRAEGILQQLNKQVERIEETRPMGTLTETLKITSTVTNWAPPSHPRRNMEFTLVNQYPPFSMQTPCVSLSELFKKEDPLPNPGNYSRNLFKLPPSPQIPALTSPTIMPQSSFLSKFLCR